MTTQTEAQQCADYLDGGSQWKYTNIFAPMKYRAAAELRRLEAANAELLEALVDVSYKLEKTRIWGGMDWTYNPLHPLHPLHPVHYLPARDKVRAVIAKHGGAA